MGLFYILVKEALASFPTAYFVVLRALFYSVGPLCSYFPAEACTFCKLFWPRQHHQGHFSSLLLSGSPSVLATPSSLPFFLLSLFRTFGKNYFFSLVTLRRGALLPAIYCIILYLMSTHLSDWSRIVSSKFFDTHARSVFGNELVRPPHARCALSFFFTATEAVFCIFVS